MFLEAAAREERLDRVDTVMEGTAGPADDPTEDPAEWETLVEEHYQVVAPQMADLPPPSGSRSRTITPRLDNSPIGDLN